METIVDFPNKDSAQKNTKERVQFYLDSSGLLKFCQEEKEVNVFLKPNFPWTDPMKYLSFRDEADKELYYLDSLDDLDPASKSAVEQALMQANFVLKIQSIYSLEEEFELRNWKVQLTNGKDRVFQTKLDEWPMVTKDKRIFIRDICGDLYLVKNAESLDAKSRKILWAFID